MTDQNVDEAKGRAKEAAGAGAAADDKDLKREGKADQAKSSVKDAVDRAAETAKSLFGRNRK
ncbi:MAG: CsbD family protein [Solirubrobacterales bacterium]|nr:CsbD family protein [Solirubrobacterales bacterium]